MSTTNLQKKILRYRSGREKAGLRPPYDCTYCEGFGCVQVTKKHSIYIFRCKECNLYETIPIVPWMELIDYYNLVSDKWLSKRYERGWKSPTYSFTVDPHRDQRLLTELLGVTMGKVSVFIHEGGKLMPITIKEAIKLPKDAPERAIVDWTRVVIDIIASEKYYSAKEVRTIFAKDEVKTFRTKSMMDKAVEEGYLARYWSKGKYIYGKPVA